MPTFLPLFHRQKRGRQLREEGRASADGTARGGYDLCGKDRRDGGPATLRSRSEVEGYLRLSAGLWPLLARDRRTDRNSHVERESQIRPSSENGEKGTKK